MLYFGVLCMLFGLLLLLIFGALETEASRSIHEEGQEFYVSATCNPGFYKLSGSCLMCEVGKYTSTIDASECILAPIGMDIFISQFVRFYY